MPPKREIEEEGLRRPGGGRINEGKQSLSKNKSRSPTPQTPRNENGQGPKQPPPVNRGGLAAKSYYRRQKKKGDVAQSTRAG